MKKTLIVLTALCAGAAANALASPPRDATVRTASGKGRTTSIEVICRNFADYDQDGDGQIEIAKLERIAGSGKDGKRVLVLVESRLLQSLDGAVDLAPLLERLADDLADEGKRADVVSVELPKSRRHQDGRYVLALREFFRAVDCVEGESSLSGVILVGHFPDAYLVRTCNWQRRGNLTLHKGRKNKASYRSVQYLRRVPEAVAQRADIVLADLDGRWEDVYVQPRTRLDTVVAVFGERIPSGGGECLDVQQRSVTYEDFFHVADGTIEVHEQDEAGSNSTSLRVTFRDEEADRETSEKDSELSNRIAQPEIFVSRLDAKGVALSPTEKIVGLGGTTLLDEQGRPQTLKFASPDDIPRREEQLFEADPRLERRLLAEYLDRNHAYRTGAAETAWRCSSIACGLRSGYRVMKRAASDWEEPDPKLADVHGRPSLERFVEWIDYPAVLRTIRAHSDPLGSQFGRTKMEELDVSLNGPAWAWARHGDRLEPSLSSVCRRSQLNWYLLRSLWENDQVSHEPCFYYHTGCNGISPIGAGSLAYDDPKYGKRQAAEALLLFGNGLALVGRAKVYYDEPRGFVEALRDGATFGDAWSRYFQIESRAKSPGNIGRKRAYYWSVLGDWTLRLDTAAPSGSGEL